jgi:hypothetical protein
MEMVRPMTDELDPDLRRLFAQTAESPADEAFVSTVARKTSRARKLQGVALGSAFGLAVALTAAVLASGAGLVANEAAATALQIAASFSASPVGWVAGLALAFAGSLCLRLLGPLRAGWRD